MDNFSATEQAYKNGYENGRQDAMKWIPVSERLPEQSGDFIVYCGNGYIGILPYSVQYKLFNTFDGLGTKCAIAVTHWMPLPDAPKGE